MFSTYVLSSDRDHKTGFEARWPLEAELPPVEYPFSDRTLELPLNGVKQLLVRSEGGSSDPLHQEADAGATLRSCKPEQEMAG